MTAEEHPYALVAEHRVPMRDGVALATDVYRAPGGRVPALLHRTPYGRRDLQQRAAEADPLRAVRDGFAAVFQDVRGRGGSDGAFAALTRDGEDGADTIGWIRRQPWSDGRVVTIGGSYNGILQFQTARERPEGLVGMAPAVSGALRSTWFEGGALRLAGLAGWLSALLAEARPHERDPARLAEIDALLGASAIERLHALLEPGSLAAELGGAIAHWLSTSPDDPYWTEVTAVPPAPLPAIHSSGWYDCCLPGAIAAYEAWSAVGDPAAPQLLTLGPWEHGLRPAVWWDLGMTIERTPPSGFVLDRELAFLRRLLGIGPVVELPPVASFVLGRNRWHEGASWPPAGVRPRELALVPRGGLVAGAPGEAAKVGYRYDPRDPVPTHGGAVCVPGRGGPLEQGPVEAHADVLTFTSAPLERELELAGRPVARLVVRSSAPATDFLARLTLVREDGASFPLAEGIWSGRLADLPAASLGWRVCEIALNPTHVAFAPGMRVRLQVTSSCHPEIYPNPNTGHDLRDGPPPRVVVAEQTLLVGLGGSSLTLPVLGEAISLSSLPS